MNEHIQNTLSQLPHQPGVYRYFDKEDELIYVGKAKDLKNRVSSYFQKSAQHSQKTLRLIYQIVRIEYTLVNTEFDALLLENSLIKKNQPKYNILLKDDKTYPYICILNERFPRIIQTKNLDQSKGTYFGPYASTRMVYTILELFQKLYSLRTCVFNLSKENIEAKKISVCLDYHIGNCLGPCEKLQSEEEYLVNIELAKNILKGNLTPAKEFLEAEMQKYAAELAFEKAQKVKEKFDSLQHFQAKSVVANPKLGELDVFTLISDDKEAFVNFLKVQNGTVTVTKTLEIKKKLDEEDITILQHAITIIREDIGSKAKEIITNLENIEEVEQGIILSTPKIGDKRKLVELSLKNALAMRKDKITIRNKVNPNRLLEQVQEDLRLRELPTHIECFDNSNLQGTNPVSSMVCFKNGKPSKKDYRHFKIKTVVGPDDFASMYEVVSRRYARLLEEKQDLPKLIVIDGGKGQLGMAHKALKDLGIEREVPLISIAKRLEELYYVGDQYPLMLSKKSETLRLIQQLRDEAHRFAITFHRNVRSDNFIKLGIENIEGIGPKTIQKLLQEFKTMSKIKEASIDQLSKIIGKSRAEKLKQQLTKDRDE